MLTCIHIFHPTLQKSHPSLLRALIDSKLQTNKLISPNSSSNHFSEFGSVSTQTGSWSEMRSTAGQPPSASYQHLPNCDRKLWAEAEEGEREGWSDQLLPPQLWAAVFTIRPQEAPCVYIAWLQGSWFPFKMRHTSPEDWPQNNVTGENGSKSTMALGFRLQLCPFCCNWTQTRGPDVDPVWWVNMSFFVCLFPSRCLDNMRKTDQLTNAEFL